MNAVHDARAVPSSLERNMMPVDVHHIPQVALSFMNDDHHLEACLLNDLVEVLEQHRGSAAKGVVLERLDALLVHTREHFAREESAMEESGFPAYPVHKAEHDRVLDELQAEARGFQEKGDAARLAAYVSKAVPAWFVQHIQSMDLVTSRFVAARAA
jgi:hemerythrin